MNNLKITPDKIAAASNVGLIREVNEDSFIYSAYPKSPNTLVAVADGVGGHEGGDIASSTCLKMMMSSWREMNMSYTACNAVLKNFFKSELARSNKFIFDINQRSQLRHPMGTTVVGAIFTEKESILSHAGDSRCYRLRQGKLEQLTKDHTVVEELLAKNIITPEEALGHPLSHIISKCIGPQMDTEAEINSFSREPEDRYLFCTDGLTGMVALEFIHDTMLLSKTAEEATENLLNESLKQGGEDNVTILTVFT